MKKPKQKHYKVFKKYDISNEWIYQNKISVDFNSELKSNKNYKYEEYTPIYNRLFTFFTSHVVTEAAKYLVSAAIGYALGKLC